MIVFIRGTRDVYPSIWCKNDEGDYSTCSKNLMNKGRHELFFKITGNSKGVKKQKLLSKIFVDLGLTV